MSTAILILVQDVLAGEREEHALRVGARLSDELMRLFPEGIEGAWKLYQRDVLPALELDVEDAEHIVIEDGERLILVRTPGSPGAVALFNQLVVAIFLSFAQYVLTPFPQRSRNPIPLSEQQESGTNQLAAQRNLLRAGARVPDILGRMRIYPDLLTNPVETWTWPTKQQVLQYFVIGVGTYELEQTKLGETPLAQITGQSPMLYTPGMICEEIPVVRFSPTVDNLSLDAVLGAGDVAVGEIQLIAATNTLESPTRLELTVGEPINIANTLGAVNDGDYFVASAPPPEQTTPPYVYGLDGDVAADETVTPTITRWSPFGGGEGLYSDAGFTEFWAHHHVIFGTPEVGNPAPGVLAYPVLAEILHEGYRYVGRIVSVYYTYDEPTTNVLRTDMSLPTTIYRTTMNFTPSWMFEPASLTMWSLPEGEGSLRTVPSVTSDEPLFSAWMVAALPDPDELWLDIAFPQGLVHYASGVPGAFSVDIVAEFRRVGTESPVVTLPLPTFTATRRTYLRRTVQIEVATLGLAGSGPIEVRLQRVTPIPADSATDQYQSETRWATFRAMKRLPPRRIQLRDESNPDEYPEVTIFRLGLQNTRAASSLGENAFNAVAHRVVRSWNGSSWDAPAPSDKWADNFLERCTHRSGANRDDDEIDLAGVRSLQLALDALGDGGDQGRIALALDQSQDIDAELAQIADVARAVVYRVGRKVYVARDQANAAPIALFNGRTKSSDGEMVSMRMKSEDEHDAVQVQWFDELSGWKMRELIYADPPNPTPTNVLRAGPVCANWAQAWRRAAYEWNRILYQREQIAVSVTEDGRICRPGDVVHITDDIANLALAAGEVLYVSGLQLVVDRDLDFSAPGTYSVLLRDVEGVAIDAIPCTALAGFTNRLQLARAPSVTIKGRDEGLGTLYAFYNDASAAPRQWLLTSVEASGPSVTLQGLNYTSRVYAGDGATLPLRPPLVIE